RCRVCARGGPMTPSGTPIPRPPRPSDRPRPRSLGAICAVAALAIACGGGGEPARSAADGSAAPPAQAAPAEARAASPGKPDPIEAQAVLGAELYDGGRSADAERVYSEVLKSHP